MVFSTHLCIGGPFIGSLLKRAPNRVVAAVMAQPVGWRPEMRDRKYQGAFWSGWPAQITAKRPEITMQTADQFVTKMFETNPDFLLTVLLGGSGSRNPPPLAMMARYRDYQTTSWEDSEDNCEPGSRRISRSYPGAFWAN